MLGTENFLKIDYTGVMKGEHHPQGWTEEDLLALEPSLNAAQDALEQRRKTGGLDFSFLLEDMRGQAGKIRDFADSLRDRIDNFVVLGIGGSALGPQAVQLALNPYYFNELPVEERRRPRLYVLDNIDPSRFAHLLDMLDLHKTVFNVITKSGSTSETMAQFLIVRERLRQACGADYANHIVVTTDHEKGNLLPIARREGYVRFVIPAGVGGRFSELTPVGLLPAAVCGIDIGTLLAGALAMDQKIRESRGITVNPAQLMAGISHAAWREGKNVSVFMPYADSLKMMADWYAQLWAESLGKRLNREGQEVRLGQTPVKALGVTDQHSQVQLYAEGPDDKMFTFVSVAHLGPEVPIPTDESLPESVRFLGGHTLGELLAAEERATEYALTLAGRPHRRIILPEVNAYCLGQLLLLLEWETAYMGELLNINAFDQPGVEEGKRGTYALMGRPGFEEKRRAIEGMGERRFIV
ncbi:Glucose-6-phosphate isomerase [Acididesulfobacillus acetoxydans]|uniref:Glucose-6-phosphate isomerase n=1 Tax=Acididesulfobacillus acetoxydans TaxID=1561005 RepID=A0A8S0XBH7_9FIRM|nr:glucose-6-phosphate isomerase [Acididesulfobacillus acetoxydans]CAA7601256.1 Glucose-6-phosphate isomerase [Acididesulfobacillus acetoxydans]CEJ08465.1 Glucose-6-phosphate isomerase [Acididesulfobacillus acetoxydans]